MSPESSLQAGSKGLLLIHKPVRKSSYLILAALAGIGCLVLDGFTVFLHKNYLVQKHLLYLPILIFLQIINIWIRFYQYQSAIAEAGIVRQTGEDAANSKPELLAMGGMIGILLWSLLLIFLLLFYVMELLSN